MFVQPYKALQMLGFIEKTQFNKSSSPDKEESSRDSKDTGADSDTCRASVSQVHSVVCTKLGTVLNVFSVISAAILKSLLLRFDG